MPQTCTAPQRPASATAAAERPVRVFRRVDMSARAAFDGSIVAELRNTSKSNFSLPMEDMPRAFANEDNFLYWGNSWVLQGRFVVRLGIFQ